MTTAACAHRRVVYVRVTHEGGTCSDKWECADCKTPFWPQRSAPDLWDDAYIDERLGRDASWPQIIEAANYSIKAAVAAATQDK